MFPDPYMTSSRSCRGQQRAAADLVDPRRSGLGSDVDHVDPGGNERRQNEPVPGSGRVAEAAAAGVPTGVMQLIVQVRHRQPVDHLQTGRVRYSGPNRTNRTK